MYVLGQQSEPPWGHKHVWSARGREGRSRSRSRHVGELFWPCRGLHLKLLEAFILSVTLISALLTGTCMLHMLCTPTRFKVPKGERSHGDT